MSVFCILVNKTIQPFWNDCAVRQSRTIYISHQILHTFYFYTFNYFCAARIICSLGGLNWLRIKVAFSIHRGFFLSVRGIAGIHIVRRDRSCYGTQAGHGDLEKLCIKFLGFE